MELREAKVLITGGSSGIGLETAKMLKEKGAQVVIAGRTAETLEKAAKEIDCYWCVGDVCNEEDVQRVVQFSIEKMDGLNVLINNAGFGHFAKLVDMQTSDFRRLLETNVVGAMMAGRECAKYFMQMHYGNIINVASTSALKGHNNGTAYSTSKWALRGMTECWRDELREYNIRVMMVHPSEVQTNFVVNSGREKRAFNATKLEAQDIAHLLVCMLEMRDVGFIPEAVIWSTNPR